MNSHRSADEIATLRAEPEILASEYAAICHEFGCIVKLGVALTFAKDLRARLGRSHTREAELIRMWDRASPTERQELDRMRRGWGPSSPTERVQRRGDVLTCINILSIVMSDLTVGEGEDVPEDAQERLDAAYEMVSKAHLAAMEVHQAISVDPAEWPDIALAEERGAAAAQAENARLRIALHDAIRRPLGVTPDSAVEFYDQRMADEAEERRPRYGTEAEIAERPEFRADLLSEQVVGLKAENASLRGIANVEHQRWLTAELDKAERERDAARVENTRLRKALQPFADAAGFWEIESQEDDGQQILVKPGEGFASELTVKDFRRARAVIRGEGEQ